jgi:hypothetical protein
VRALLAEVELARRIAIEADAEVEQALDLVRTVVNAELDDLAIRVSSMWVAKLSSLASTAATPPWAQLVFVSVGRFFVMTVTVPCSAANSAKFNPAMPDPMTR